MRDPKKFLVVLPAYNAGKKLDAVLRELKRHFNSAQIGVVNDGSTDDTATCTIRNGVTLLSHQKNRGKGAALQTAFDYALTRTHALAVLALDADGQHAPEDIPKFIACFEQSNADLIIGARDFSSAAMPIMRRWSNRITSKLLSLRVGHVIQDSQSGYRLYSRRLLQALRLRTKGYETESEIIIQACRKNMQVRFVPITTIYNDSTSHIRGVRDILRFLKLYFHG